jgi:hypothetical protein
MKSAFFMQRTLATRPRTMTIRGLKRFRYGRADRGRSHLA